MQTAMDRRSTAPLYSQLRDELKRRIRSGGLAAGERLPPVRQLSRDYDLSFLTVTRALAELTREGWIGARRGVGTFVLPRQMEVGIEVLMAGHPPRTTPMIVFHDQILAGLRRGAEPLPCRLWVSYLDGRWPTGRELADVARSKRLAGLVVYSPPEDLHPALREAALCTPIASIRTPVPDSAVDCVQPDPGAALRRMLRGRITAGARALAYVGYGRMNAAPYNALYAAFQDTLREAGIEPFIHIAPAGTVDATWRMERLNQWVAGLAAGLPEGCVVVCQTAHVAEEIVRAGRPLDAISYTESRATVESLRERVSFLCVPMESLAREAVKLLLSRPGVESSAGRTVGVTAEVCERGSAVS